VPVTAKRILLGVTALILAAAVTAVFVTRYSVPRFNMTPVAKGAPPLDIVDVEKILGSNELDVQLGPHRFRTFRRVRQIPVAVKQSFTNFTGLPLDIADPGQEMSSDDMTSGAPTRRLVFLAFSDDSSILVYKQGGFVGTLNVVIFYYPERGGGWSAVLKDPVRDIESLRTAIRRGHFHVSDSVWEKWFDSAIRDELKPSPA
jgi:hypothetical protein